MDKQIVNKGLALYFYITAALISVGLVALFWMGELTIYGAWVVTAFWAGAYLISKRNK